MRWVRSTFFARLIAGLLVASMLPTLVAAEGQASPLSTQGSYEKWIRAQLRAPVDAALEEALARAAESGPRTFKAFVAAFLDAYEDQRSDVPAARAFTDRDLSDDALIAYLQRRFTEIAGEAVLPRLHQIAATSASGTSAVGSSATIEPAAALTVFSHGSGAVFPAEEHVVRLRILSSARSRGP